MKGGTGEERARRSQTHPGQHKKHKIVQAARGNPSDPPTGPTTAIIDTNAFRLQLVLPDTRHLDINASRLKLVHPDTRHPDITRRTAPNLLHLGEGVLPRHGSDQGICLPDQETCHHRMSNPPRDGDAARRHRATRCTGQLSQRTPTKPSQWAGWAQMTASPSKKGAGWRSRERTAGEGSGTS
jgi:hypothetical protein